MYVMFSVFAKANGCGCILFQAYSSWMVGNVKFEQQKWQEALDAFGQCQ